MFLHSQYNAATYVSHFNKLNYFFFTFDLFSFNLDKANDIAIIVMDSPVVLAKGVASTVCLPPAGTDDDYVDQDAIILGWGAPTAGNKRSQTHDQFD
jgi:hypothetical protein